ncbi:MAG: hypothetical protein HY654_06640 [Acidobacteria bacterium]|nr:hypothetical protein [Acidobacteriota bacterium]
MMNVACPREQEALEVAFAGTLSDGGHDGIRAHLATCSICADVVRVATAIREDADSCRMAHLPGSGIVWWRAQMRARAEAARAASKPITFVQGIAAACLVGAAVAGLGVAFPWIRAWFGSMGELARAIEAGAGASPLLGLPLWVPLLAVLTLLLAPVAIYLAVTKD